MDGRIFSWEDLGILLLRFQLSGAYLDLPIQLLIEETESDCLIRVSRYLENVHMVNHMIQTEADNNLDILLPVPNANDTIEMETALSTITNKKCAWVVDQAKFLPTKQKYWYTACGNCLKPLNAKTDWIIKCPACEEDSGIVLRGRIALTLLQDDTSMQFTMYSPDIENLTGITPNMLRDGQQFEELDIDQDLAKAFDNLVLFCFIKNYDKNSPGSSVKKFTAVKSYVWDIPDAAKDPIGLY